MTVATRTLVLAIAPFREAALLVGPLAARRRVFPEETVTIASSPGVCEVVRALGLARDVWPISSLSDPASAATGVFQNIALLGRARRARFDAVIDLFPGLVSGLAAVAAGGNRGLAEPGQYVEGIFGSRKSSRRLADPLLRLSQLLGVGDSPKTMDVAPHPDADSWIEKALQSTGYRGGGPVVTFHTSAQWTATQLVDLATSLRSQCDAWIVVVDTPGEGNHAKQIAGAVGGRVLGIGAPSGERFLAVLARSSLVVSDDTGVAYLASLLRVRTVLVRVGLNLHAPVARHLVVCAGPTPDAIRVDDVRDAAAQLLAKSRTSSLFED